MHGSVPFGMSCGEAAGYAHKAMSTASAAGTGVMMALAEMMIQMLIESLQQHHQQKRIRDIERVLEQLEEVERWYAKAQLNLEADQDTDSGQETGTNLELGQKLVNLPDQMEKGLGIMSKSQEEKEAWARKAIERYNEKHGIKEPQGPKGPTLER